MASRSCLSLTTLTVIFTVCFCFFIYILTISKPSTCPLPNDEFPEKIVELPVSSQTEAPQSDNLLSDENIPDKKPAFSADPYTLIVRNTIHNLKSLNLSINSTVARPLLRNKAYYRVAPRYHLSECHVEKSMCTLLQSIFCYLYDSEGFIKANRTIPTEFWDGRYCENRNEITSTEELHLRIPFNSATIFISRRPVERFISGFIDKCVNENSTCYGCSANLLCVVEGFHKEIMELNREHWNVTIPKRKPIEQGYETQHFAPSNWMCDLYDEAESFIFIKYGETLEELNAMYKKLANAFLAYGVEAEKVSYILNSISKRTKHATKTTSPGSREKYFEQLKSSPAHVMMLNEVYFYDNHIFGFDPL